MLSEEQQWLGASGVREGAVTAQPSLIVGLGGGDGALEALKALFIAIDDSAGMSFVVVQHFDRNGTAALSEIIEQFTELRVQPIRDRDAVEPDRIYVVPAGHVVEVQEGHFSLSPRLDSGANRIGLDTLFRSLARTAGTRAVGIVLSGAGDDGTEGVQAIARAGGLTLVSDPERARCGEMPRNALASGVIDRVLSPFEMPEALLARNSAVALERTAGTSHGLQDTVDELTQANAELRRLNRELLAIHSQLHASIERLQTALDKLEQRNQELAGAQTQMCELLSEGVTAVLQLDAEGRVCSYSGRIELIYTLSSADIGKPIETIPHRAHDMPPLPRLADFRDDGAARDDDVVTRDRWYLRRSLPQYAGDGLVITFVDVTQLKLSEAAAQPHENWLRNITDASPAIISFVDDALQGF